jgi:hypothetical protein
MVVTSGCVPASVFRQLGHRSQNSSGACALRQFKAFAIISAQVCFPTPEGPEKIIPCGNRPSRSFARSLPMILRLPIKESNVISKLTEAAVYKRG